MYYKVEFNSEIKKGTVSIINKEKTLSIDRVKGAEDFLLDFLNKNNIHKEDIIKIELIENTELTIPNSFDGYIDY